MSKNIYTMTIRNFFIKGWFDYDFDIDSYSFENISSGIDMRQRPKNGKIFIVKPSDEFSHIFWEQYLIEAGGARGLKTIFPAGNLSIKIQRNGKFSEGFIFEFFELEIVFMDITPSAGEFSGGRKTEQVTFKYKDVSVSRASNI